MNNGYGGGSNPFDQRGGGANPPYPTSQPSYGRQQYNNGPSMGRGDYGGQNVEMAPLAQNGQQFGYASNPGKLLDQVQQISEGVEQIDLKLDQLGSIQTRSLNAVGTDQIAATRAELAALNDDIQVSYGVLASKLGAVKRDPESRNIAKHIINVRKKIDASIAKRGQIEATFRQNSKAQNARQLRIAFPDAPEAEIRAAAEDPSGEPIFARAFQQSGQRQRDVRTVLQNNKDRSADVARIAQGVQEIAELFNQLDALVVQQEAAVTNIEMQSEEVVENMDKGTEQIGTAIESARNARKWKWWCLGICVLITVIIVIVILIYKFVIVGTPAVVKSNKRYVLPGTPWPGVNTVGHPVLPGVPWTPPSKRSIAFVG